MRTGTGRFSRATLGVALLTMLLVVGLVLFLPDVALAGPGGIVKAAARTTVGKIAFALLILVFLPFVVYILGKRALAIRRTRRDLARLAQLYPQYNWLDIRQQVTAAYTWMWSAWSDEKLEKARRFTTDWYWANQQMLLDDWEAQGLKNVCKLYHVNHIVPLHFEHRADHGVDGEGSRLIVSISGLVADYMKERATDKVVQGDKKSADLEAVWTFVWADGQWRLNMIEQDAMEYAYLELPNVLPSALRQPSEAAKG